MNCDCLVKIILVVKGKNDDAVNFLQKKFSNESVDGINVKLIPECQISQDGRYYLVVFLDNESIKKYDKEVFHNKVAYMTCHKRMSDLYREVEKLNISGIMVYGVDEINVYELKRRKEEN